MAKETIVRVVKEPDDPICPRISIGGAEGVGYYVVYRGDLEIVKKILVTCTKRLEKFEEVDGILTEKK